MFTPPKACVIEFTVVWGLPLIALLLGTFLLPGCDLNPNEPPTPTSFEHPDIKPALETKEQLRTHRITLCSVNENIDQVITEAVQSVSLVNLDDSVDLDASAELGPYSQDSLTPEAAVTNLIESTRKLRVMALDFLDRQDEYLESIRLYRQAALKAPAQFRQASKVFDQFAKEEPYQDFQEDYLVMSRVLLSLANHYESQREVLVQEFDPKTFLDAIDYLERGALMLDRFETALEIGRLSSELDQAADLVRQLGTVVKTFEDFRLKIRRINQVLEETEPASVENADQRKRDKKNRAGGKMAGTDSSVISPTLGLSSQRPPTERVRSNALRVEPAGLLVLTTENPLQEAAPLAAASNGHRVMAIPSANHWFKPVANRGPHWYQAPVDSHRVTVSDSALPWDRQVRGSRGPGCRASSSPMSCRW